MSRLLEIEVMINAGINSYEQLDLICQELLSFQKENEGFPTAQDLIELLRPEWSSKEFYAWTIGE